MEGASIRSAGQNIRIPTGTALQLAESLGETGRTVGHARKSRPFITLRRTMVAFSAIVLAGFFAVSILAPISAPDDPLAQDLGNLLAFPEVLSGKQASHWMGTDALGRDILSRLMFGARNTFFISSTAVALSAAVGTGIGLSSGYFGGWADSLLAPIIDLHLAFPPVLLAVVLATSLGPGLWNVIIILVLVLWPQFARAVRAESLALSSRPFIEGARAIGSTNTRILLVHLLPNIAPSIIILVALLFSRAILLEAAFSFLGLGVPPPAVSWGGMISQGQNYLAVAWWLSTLPGIAISLVVVAVSIVAEELREHLTPWLE